MLAVRERSSSRVGSAASVRMQGESEGGEGGEGAAEPQGVPSDAGSGGGDVPRGTDG